jgi:hypothetical protein
VAAIDTLFVIRAGALILLALGSGLVLRIVTLADAAEHKPKALRPQSRSAPEAPDPLRRAA